MDCDKSELQGVYRLFQPKAGAIPLLIDSPHSGRNYPPDFRPACSDYDLIATEDNHIDHIIQNSHEIGASVLFCDVPRCYIDVNRTRGDIDHALVKGNFPYPTHPTPRSAHGYGLIRRLIKPGLPVYERYLSADEILTRIETYYDPYHAILEQTLNQMHYEFGQVYYINMHSMPSSSARNEDGHPVDFVIGDRYGTTCRKDLIYALQNYLQSRGYRVSLNDPYKGVELIRRHSHPAMGRHALQFEINKNLYWIEKEQKLSFKAYSLKEEISLMFQFISSFIEKELVQLAAD